MAEKIGAAVVVVEHRYWGESTPYKVLTSENLKYLDLKNSIQDMVYFAHNFKAPFDPAEGATAPGRVPWLYSGGSYSGALAGWIAAKAPGTFWAIHGSSGVVEAVADMWTMFVPVQEAMPRNCSRDVSAAIDYMDGILMSGSQAQKDKLKAKFKLDGLSDADFGQAIENGPWLWQSTQFYSANKDLGGPGFNSFHRFCDYVEGAWPGSTTPVPGEKGVGSCKAVEGYAKWFTELWLPGQCESSGYPEWQGQNNTACYQNQNASNPQYHDLRYNNPDSGTGCCAMSPSAGGKTAPPRTAPRSSRVSSTTSTGWTSASSGSPAVPTATPWDGPRPTSTPGPAAGPTLTSRASCTPTASTTRGARSPSARPSAREGPCRANRTAPRSASCPAASTARTSTALTGPPTRARGRSPTNKSRRWPNGSVSFMPRRAWRGRGRARKRWVYMLEKKMYIRAVTHCWWARPAPRGEIQKRRPITPKGGMPLRLVQRRPLSLLPDAAPLFVNVILRL
ncbi:hypothetical protein RB601_003867 [Gaeumannomyces tritici]